MFVSVFQVARFALASIVICPMSPLPRNHAWPPDSMLMESNRSVREVFAGVTAAQLVPTRSSSHCIAAGRELAPEAAFCRKLKRSMANAIPLAFVSVPVVAEIKPLTGLDAAPNVLNAVLIHSETAVGDRAKSYFPTSKSGAPAGPSKLSKTSAHPFPIGRAQVSTPDKF